MGAVVAVVDTVRTRVLQFALELQTEIGEGGENELPAPEDVTRAVQTIIYGGNNIVGNVAGDVQIVGQQVVIQGDFESLAKALNEAGIANAHVLELREAITGDAKEGHKETIGPRVLGWLKRAGAYVGKEGVKVAAGVAQKVVTTAVMAYFGVGSAE